MHVIAKEVKAMLKRVLQLLLEVLLRFCIFLIQELLEWIYNFIIELLNRRN